MAGAAEGKMGQQWLAEGEFSGALIKRESLPGECTSRVAHFLLQQLQPKSSETSQNAGLQGIGRRECEN